MAGLQRQQYQAGPLVVPAMVSNVAGIREKLRAVGGGATRKHDAEFVNAKRGPLIVKHAADPSPTSPREKTISRSPRVERPLQSPGEERLVSPGTKPSFSLFSPQAVKGTKYQVKEATSIHSPIALKTSPLPKATSATKPSSHGLPCGRKGLRRPTSLVSLLPVQTFQTPRSRPPSPSYSLTGSCCGRRTPSPGSVLDPALLEVVRARVLKVRAVRLYLMQRVGPHSFLVAADPPEHKYKVTIGPQSCTCGKGAYCIHVLFVMLRVLQVRETDPKIFSRTLKNFEVEELTKQYIWRRRQQQVRSSMGRSGVLGGESATVRELRRLPPSRSGSSNIRRGPTLTASKSESSIQEALKEKNMRQNLGVEEESQALCPICLLDMVEGETLVTCEKGCRNKLHHHCIAIWAEECRSKNENILCPLCRALWPTPAGITNTTQNSRNKVKVKPIPKEHLPTCSPKNSAVPLEAQFPAKPYLHYPQPPPTSSIFSSCKSSPPKKSLTARDSLKAQETQTWSQVFGRDFVSWILSPHWSSREKGLKWLGREVASILSLSQEIADPGGGGTKTNLALLASKADCHMVVNICCRVVAFMVTDPVYKVFIAALRVWRSLLAHSLCKTETDLNRLFELTKPIVRAVLLKCADGSRRTSQLGIASLVELARGQSGAFAIGSQTQEPDFEFGNKSRSVDYLLMCSIEESSEESQSSEKGGGSVNWQWLLGRLALVERLMEEFPQEFYLLYAPSLPTEMGGSLGVKAESCYKILNYDRLLSLLEFTKNALQHPHSTVNKMAHRIFVMASRFSAHIPPVFSQVLEIVNSLDSTVQRSLFKKLEAILEDLKSPPPWSVYSQNGNQPPKKSKKAESESQQERNLIQEKLVVGEDSTQRLLGRLLPSRLKLPGFGKGSEKRRPCHLPLRKTNSALLDSPSKCAKSSQTTLDHSEVCIDLYRDEASLECGLNSPDASVTDDLIDLSPSLTLDSCCSPMSFGTEFSTPLSPTSYLTPWNTSGAKNARSPFTSSQGERGFELCPVIPGLRDSPNDMIINMQPDISPDSVHMQNSEQGLRAFYVENTHWFRGPLLGTGAFSTCYQARDVQTGVLMAVKQVSFYRNEESEQEKVMEGIQEEIVMMGKLRHPNILRILGSTKQGGHYNVFVEWMAGGSVANLLEHYGPFCEQVLLGYTRQILDGLSYLHSNKILHRDLKGANLLLDSTAQNLRIADFGAAARLASQKTLAGEFQGQLLGTIAFMAPEVLRGEDYGRACDIWSVGCVVIEMATTKPPWNASDISNHLALIFKIACSNAPPAIPEHLSAGTQDFVLQCLRVKCKERPSAKQLLQHAVLEANPSITDNGHNLNQTTNIQKHSQQHQSFSRDTCNNQVPTLFPTIAY